MLDRRSQVIENWGQCSLDLIHHLQPSRSSWIDFFFQPPFIIASVMFFSNTEVSFYDLLHVESGFTVHEKRFKPSE